VQFKPVPVPPDDLEGVEPILAAVPTVAGAVDDCCAHLLEESRLETRTEAETWLTFLRALEVVTEESAGYRRRSTDEPVETALDPTVLGQSFRERVYGVDSIVGIVEQADGPLIAEDVLDRVRAESDAGIHESRAGRFETDTLEWIHRLLKWAVILNLVNQTGSETRYDAPSDVR